MLTKGFHKHHIQPRYLGGSDDENNLVLLHPIDHAIWHLVRYKMFGDINDLRSANLLMGKIDGSKFGDDRSGDKNPNFGKRWSQEQKDFISRLNTGRKQSSESVARRVAKNTGQIRRSQSEYMKQRWIERKNNNLNGRIGSEGNKNA